MCRCFWSIILSYVPINYSSAPICISVHLFTFLRRPATDFLAIFGDSLLNKLSRVRHTSIHCRRLMKIFLQCFGFQTLSTNRSCLRHVKLSTEAFGEEISQGFPLESSLESGSDGGRESPAVPDGESLHCRSFNFLVAGRSKSRRRRTTWEKAITSHDSYLNSVAASLKHSWIA